MQTWFREQMAMYTAYHRDVRNCATHFVGVPMIVFSLLVALSAVPLGQVGYMPITLATIFLTLLLALYWVAVPLMGLVATVVHIPLLWYADAVAQDPASIWVVFVVCFFGGWVIQFVGHLFEGRRPALVDNLFQAFMAPGFLVAEALFACGFLSDLRRDLEERSSKYDNVPA